MSNDFISIKGFEGVYEINKYGDVKSLARTWISGNGKIDIKPDTILIQHIVKGYSKVSLNKKHYSVHRLVAETFIPNIENKPQVNHKDGNKQNNHVDNLEWCTCSENHKHAFATKLRKPHFGQQHQNSKLVLNTETGIFYESLTEAIKTQTLKRSTIEAMMCGRNPNRTSFIYV